MHFGSLRRLSSLPKQHKNGPFSMLRPSLGPPWVYPGRLPCVATPACCGSARHVRATCATRRFLKGRKYISSSFKNDESHESRPPFVLVKLGCGPLWARLVVIENGESHKSWLQGPLGGIFANEMLFSWFQSGRHYCSTKSTQTRTTLLSTRPRPLNAEERDAVQQSSLLPQCCRMAGVGGFLARLTRTSRFFFYFASKALRFPLAARL